MSGFEYTPIETNPLIREGEVSADPLVTNYFLQRNINQRSLDNKLKIADRISQLSGERVDIQEWENSLKVAIFQAYDATEGEITTEKEIAAIQAGCDSWVSIQRFRYLHVQIKTDTITNPGFSQLSSCGRYEPCITVCHNVTIGESRFTFYYDLDVIVDIRSREVTIHSSDVHVFRAE